MKVLIVGGTGLISTAITHFLQEAGAKVHHYNRGQADAQLAIRPPTMQGDRKDFVTFEAQMALTDRWDCVIDMICFTPEEAASTVRAFRGRTGHLIFCSTVDVYSKPAQQYPITEEAERQPQPSFPYAHAKAACERIFEEAHRRGDFPVTTIRPAYTYGEGRGLLHTFRGGMYYLQRIREGKPIIVHGDGTSLWANCHRDDVGRAFAHAAGNTQTFGKAYHVTGDEWMSWNQYHQRVATAMNAPAPTLLHIPTDLLAHVLPEGAAWCKENFQFNNIFDNSLARADLAFQYTVPWIEGVQRVVAWLDERGAISAQDEPTFYAPLIAQWQQMAATLGAAK